jgi:outer membrane protein OmpA-like peptidoglycan-associated protein
MTAQTVQPNDQQTIVNKSVEHQRVVGSDHQVISNFFKDNWFVLGDAGVNAFWGDYTVGNLSSRLTPQFNIGFGKWFVPGFGAKIQFTGFNSKENKSVETVNTRDSQTYYDGNGNPYWKENIKWWDINVNLMFNISRMIAGYEGIGSPKMMNQFFASVGLGVTRHYDIPLTSNVVSGHVELQYSRFFSPKKDFSMDVRLRGIFYGTDFDRVNKTSIDENLSLNVGFTYYFKERGWERTVANTTYYVEDRTTINQLNEEINQLRNAPVDTVVINKGVENLITFPYLVNFVIDKVEVVNRERVNLGVVAAMMKATPNQKYLICGYADKHTGTVARNIWLAEHRAKNVYKILTEEFGVPASQLVLDDKGGVENMYYDDPQLSRSAIITEYKE